MASKPENAEVLETLLGLTSRQLTDAVRNGIMPPPVAGKYDTPRCIAAYVAHLRDSRFVVSSADLGAVIDMTEAGVRKLAREQGMPRARRGDYDLRECVPWYVQRLRARAQGDEKGDEAEERRRAARLKREREQFEFDVVRRKKIDRDEHDNAITRLAGVFVASLESMVAQWAPQMVGLRTAPESRERLKAMSRTVRNELADELVRIEEELSNGLG